MYKHKVTNQQIANIQLLRCIVSYAVAMADHRCFSRKRWHYMILDEAINEQ